MLYVRKDVVWRARLEDGKVRHGERGKSRIYLCS